MPGSDINIDLILKMNFKPKRIKDRIEAIKKDPEKAYEHAKFFIKKRWPEAEPYIMKDPQAAYKYAVNFIKGRWPEAEPYIMQNPYWAQYYVENVIKGRWPEAEPYIMKDARAAAPYANLIPPLFTTPYCFDKSKFVVFCKKLNPPSSKWV